MKRLFNRDVPFITYIIHDKNMKNGRTVTVYKPTQEYYILFELIKFRRLPSTFPDIGITVISEGLEPSSSDVSVTQDVLTDIKTAQSNEMENPKMTLKVTANPYVEIFYSHIKDLNFFIDKLGPLVARAIDFLTPPTLEAKYGPIYDLRTNLRVALDQLTEVQNREYRDPNSQELLDTSTGKDDLQVEQKGGK